MSKVLRSAYCSYSLPVSSSEAGLFHASRTLPWCGCFHLCLTSLNSFFCLPFLTWFTFLVTLFLFMSPLFLSSWALEFSSHYLLFFALFRQKVQGLIPCQLNAVIRTFTGGFCVGFQVVWVHQWLIQLWLNRKSSWHLRLFFPAPSLCSSNSSQISAVSDVWNSLHKLLHFLYKEIHFICLWNWNYRWKSLSIPIGLIQDWLFHRKYYPIWS